MSVSCPPTPQGVSGRKQLRTSSDGLVTFSSQSFTPPPYPGGRRIFHHDTQVGSEAATSSTTIGGTLPESGLYSHAASHTTESPFVPGGSSLGLEKKKCFRSPGSTRRAAQMSLLRDAVGRHVRDPHLASIVVQESFMLTSTDRGVQLNYHPHLVAALDVLLRYQDDRRSWFCQMNEARARLVELLKSWLRQRAGVEYVEEEDLRSMCGLCREVLHHQELFPSRHKHNLVHSLARVYDPLKLQLKLTLQQDHTCAELMDHCLVVGRNLLADALAVLLLAPSHLQQTDKLPSMEPVTLWQSLPSPPGESSGCYLEADAELQAAMKDAWRTTVGQLTASLLLSPWCLHLLNSGWAAQAKDAGDEASAVTVASTADDIVICEEKDRHYVDHWFELIARAKTAFDGGNFADSGLAGPFREPSKSVARAVYVAAFQVTFEISYLLGEVLVRFHNISKVLGDYGAIRLASWLHPFLDAVKWKVGELQGHLQQLNIEVESSLVLAPARNQTVRKPLRSKRMTERAHRAMERAVIGPGNHAQGLLQALDKLRGCSSAERLPRLSERLSESCLRLRDVFGSHQFRACVGNNFADRLAMAVAHQSQDFTRESIFGGFPFKNHGYDLMGRPRSGSGDLVLIQTGHAVSRDTSDSSVVRLDSGMTYLSNRTPRPSDAHLQSPAAAEHRRLLDKVRPTKCPCCGKRKGLIFGLRGFGVYEGKRHRDCTALHE
eukprot:TRINITY_DN74601_c0_g1_i1.p1 TRINITY_DN74601_c0_g1~~TRINITY_DN74601_c0_g1_i1.p1  ORF type:complete len:719 (+),score=138.46 TRINITY_DN74601_c0_g1_i1:167-2323(+)